MTEGWMKKLMGDLPSLITVAGALIALGIWVGNLKNQVDNSQQEVAQLKGQVTQLQAILEKSQSTATLSVRGPAGPQGPKGDQGDPGPRGERGLPGPQGDQGSAAQPIDVNIIRSIIQAELKGTPSSRTSGTSGASSSQPKLITFSNKQCAYTDDLQLASVLEIQQGTEICERSGKLLATLDDNASGRLVFSMPSRSDQFTCERNAPCEIPWISGKRFIVERTKGSGFGAWVQLRAE